MKRSGFATCVVHRVVAHGFPVMPAERGDMRANEVRHTRGHDDLVAECQRLDGALLVINPLPVLRVAKLERCSMDYHAMTMTGHDLPENVNVIGHEIEAKVSPTAASELIVS